IADLQFRDLGDPRISRSGTAATIINILNMRHIVMCNGDSGWRYGTKKEDEGKCQERPVIIADGEGKAQGISIEPGLRVQDVLGRMILLKEIELEIQISSEGIQKRGPALGVIGCQCIKLQEEY